MVEKNGLPCALCSSEYLPEVISLDLQFINKSSNIDSIRQHIWQSKGQTSLQHAFKVLSERVHIYKFGIAEQLQFGRMDWVQNAYDSDKVASHNVRYEVVWSSCAMIFELLSYNLVDLMF